MSQYDLIYNSVIKTIISEGIWDKDQNVRPRWADGSPAYTKAVICQQMQFNEIPGAHEVPILTTKKVAWKTAIKEMLRFYVERSNNVQGLKIWDEWMREDGTIGKAYGYQLGKKIIVGHEAIDSYDGFPMKLPIMSNQVHKLIDGLKNDPASRRHIISLWNIDDLWDMALYPCVWHSQWLVKEGTLHGIVGIRSNDMALGNPFNVFQYYVLQRMLAQVTGYKTGSLTFNINDAHIYERHVEPLKEQIFFEPFQAPKLWINPQVTNFDDFTVNDFVLVHPSISNEDLKDLNRDGALANAWYESHPSITLEVSI